ncbi:MAG: hypothetical protein NC411_10510 [Bacteroides sp.]|nr:hypothetical protein [Bacteroides sp.]
MDTVKDRLIAFLEAKKITKSEFGRQIGVSSAFVTSIRKSIQPDKIAAIQAKYPELNTSWLLTGNGDMLLQTSDAHVVGAAYPVTDRDDMSISVDFIPVSARASFIENIYIPSELDSEKIPIVPLKGEREYIDALKVFEVDGDSMLPRISNGALILTKKIPKQQWHNAQDVVVVVFGEFVTVKRILHNQLDSDGSLILIADNEAYGQMTVQLADIRAMYKAVRKISEDII